MDPKSILQTVVKRLLGTFVRHSLSALGVWLAAKGIGVLDDGTQANLTDVVIGVVCALIALTWSYVRSHVSQNQVFELTGILSRIGYFGGASVRGSAAIANPGAGKVVSLLLAGFLAAGLVSCATSSRFDPHTLETAISLKQRSLDLVSHAIESYAAHASECDALESDLTSELVYENAKGTSNLPTRKQFEILASRQFLIEAFIERWKNGEKLAPSYIEGEKVLIGNAFDAIIGLEGGKIH